MSVKIYRVDELVEERSGPVSLDDAQELVDGYVQLVVTSFGGQLLFNEDGLAREMALNRGASDVAGFMIVGDAVLLEGQDRWT